MSNNGTAVDPVGNNLGHTLLVGNNGYVTMTGAMDNNVVVSNNTVGANAVSGGNGVVGAGNAWTPDLTLTANSNNISQTDGNGVLLVGRGTSGIAKIKIQNNTVASPLAGVRNGIRVDAGNAASADDAVCVNISGNTSAGIGAAPEGIGLRKQGTTPTTNDFSVNGMAATASPGVEQFVDALNTSQPGPPFGDGNGVLLISATSGFSSCSLP
jgi:hypothetical protein